jgi:hypothetical protein
MQSVPITTDIVGSNLDPGEVYSIQHYVIQFVSDWRPPFPSGRFDIPINNIKQGVKSIKRQYNSEFLNSMHIILCLFVCLLDGV